MLGTSRESIEKAEDRELFKELCISLGEPVLQSEIATSIEHGLEVAEKNRLSRSTSTRVYTRRHRRRLRRR